ncbi:MAG: right-handed parallel beta-helix repeat-containing protein [Eubacterium sp.]|nr:right-handed parallel beta-helix repeat-containing protein [Eubacterium sp.]
MRTTKTTIKITLLFLLILAGSLMVSISAKAKTYTVSPKTKPCDRTANYENYNKNTKHFYMLRSYLAKIEKQKGGTLILKKGTYNIPNTLFVASKTKIILKKGAVIKKTKKGGPILKASSTIFQLVSSKNAKKTGVVGGHSGEHDITISGQGTIDLGYVDQGTKPVIAIIMGHNKNILVDGITIKNMKYGHMIEMDACQNITVKNCKFTGHKQSGKWNKEAINLDVPDPNRDGFNSAWSKMDKTPNESITIENCKFTNLEAGAGTHRYTGNVYQTDVTIRNNTFSKCQTVLRILNYKNVTITGNTFTDCKPNDRYKYALFFAGLRGINFSYNTFKNCGWSADNCPPARPVASLPHLLQFWWGMGYSAAQDLYDPVTSELTEDEAALFMTNTAEHSGIIYTYGKGDYSVNFTDGN